MRYDVQTKESMRITVFSGLCLLLVAGIFVSIGSGTVSLSVGETWAALTGEADADTDRIVNLIRLPRTIVTVLVGANLALAGCNLQGVLHNPLADPGIIGVSAGAGLFAMIVMLLFPEQSAMVPLAAFVGAVLSTGIVFFLAWEKGINPLRMILAGVAVATFFGGVLCVEAGGPTPGIGCAGRGIISAFEKLAELEAFETYKPDIVIYDVLGDVVCGGFAMPIRGGYAREVFIVSSGEMMALYAANNIAQAIKNFGRRGYARLKGIILNAKKIENEQELVAKAAEEIGTEVVQYVPRSGDIQIAENQGGTVSEFVKDSPMVQVYNELAERVLELSDDEEG